MKAPNRTAGCRGIAAAFALWMLRIGYSASVETRCILALIIIRPDAVSCRASFSQWQRWLRS